MTAKIQFLGNIQILLGILECKVILPIYYYLLHKWKINKPAFLGPHGLHSGRHAGFWKCLSDQTTYTNFSVIPNKLASENMA